MTNAEFTTQEGQLVIQQGEEFVTTSVIVANGLGLEHRVILQNIRTNYKEIERLGKLRVITKPPLNGGRGTTIYILTENQALIVGALCRNTKKVVDFKIKLIQAFSDANAENRKLKLEKSKYESIPTNDTPIRLPKITDYTKLYEHADQEAEFHGYMESKSKLLYKKLFIKAATGFDLPFPYGVRESDLIRIYAAFKQTPPTNQYVVREGLAICEEALECEIRYENERDQRFRERQERLDERFANRGQKRPVPTEDDPFAGIWIDN